MRVAGYMAATLWTWHYIAEPVFFFWSIARLQTFEIPSRQTQQRQFGWLQDKSETEYTYPSTCLCALIKPSHPLCSNYLKCTTMQSRYNKCEQVVLFNCTIFREPAHYLWVGGQERATYFVPDKRGWVGWASITHPQWRSPILSILVLYGLINPLKHTFVKLYNMIILWVKMRMGGHQVHT